MTAVIIYTQFLGRNEGGFKHVAGVGEGREVLM